MKRDSLIAACFLIGAMLVALAVLGVPGPGANILAQASAIDLEYWHFYSGRIGEMHNELVEEFNQLHPHIRVRPVFGGSPWTMRDKLIAALTANAGPDVASIDQFWISELAAGGHVVPVQDFIEHTPGFAMADVFSPYWETGSYRGRIWSLPFAVSNVILYYNEDLLRTLGLTAADIPRTWHDLFALGERLRTDQQRTSSRAGGSFWILDVPNTAQTGLAYYFLITLWQHGGQLFSADGSEIAIDSEAAVDTLTMWENLVQQGLLDLQRPDRAWEAGRVLFHISSSARVRTAYQDLPFQWGVAPLPQATYRVTGLGGRNLAIMRGDRQKEEAAWTFIQWMTESDVNRRWSEKTGYSPLRQSSYSSAAYQQALAAEPRLQPALHEMLYVRVRPNVPTYGEVSRVLGEAVERALYRGLDAETTIKEVAAQSAAFHERYGRYEQDVNKNAP